MSHEGLNGLALRAGGLEARLSRAGEDMARALALRAKAFGLPEGDAFDAAALHLVVEAAGGGRLLACARLLPAGDGAALTGGYAAQVYDLAALAADPRPVIELGRLCVGEGVSPDALRLLWALVTRAVDVTGAARLIGCSSFPGTDPEAHGAAFARLAARHLGPTGLRPAPRAPETVALAASGSHAPPGPMPPLLRSYLSLGGWVSDHAVIDRAMGTIHVFTALDIADLPPARARVLRATAEAAAHRIDGDRARG